MTTRRIRGGRIAQAWPVLAWLLVPAWLLGAVPHGTDPAPDFNRDIRPILSDTCFACHGPDDAKRKAGLRLDRSENALQGGKSGRPAIVAGKLDASELVRRIVSADPEAVMPPPDSGRKITAAQIEMLKRWVADGGRYAAHWAFVPPVAPTPPPVRQTHWVRSPLDQFVLAQLERNGQQPRPEAERATLLRRAALDLTGLPPTLDELDAFLADRRPDAYEQVVERLFQSPHHGERLALDWLDTARFADTHGYHIDSARDMSLWRDGVIAAFNANQRFDAFTVEQLAGDLLPDATPAQRIASGFNRNHMINYEGGAIPEEYHAAYLHDRVNTTATAWLGLTMACAQCHDHKYDPITQRDYYRFYAFFNTIDESGLDGRYGNARPLIKQPTSENSAELERRQADVQTLEAQLAGPELSAAQQVWETAVLAHEEPTEWRTPARVEIAGANGTEFERLDDGSYWAKTPALDQEIYRVKLESEPGRRLQAVRLEVLPDDRLPSHGPGRYENGNIGLSEVSALRADTQQSLAWRTAIADFSQDGYPISNAIDGKADTAWAILPQSGKSHEAVFELATAIELNASGAPPPLLLELVFHSGFPRHQPGRLRLTLTDAARPGLKSKYPSNILSAVQRPTTERTKEQVEALRDYFRKEVSPEAKKLRSQIEVARRRRDEYERDLPSAMVMGEMTTPRDTFILARGDYDKRGEMVRPGTPSFLPPIPAGEPTNRLTLARWLVSPANPLTARVIVNRYWQMFFGVGLVKSAENFGSQADWPSHPELLDWLAVEFVRSGWDLRALQRMIVTSATYRQSATAPRASVMEDPENRQLGRGPRFRLQAEAVRDLALQVSGLLQPRIGGASVFPYQPPGLWEELMSRGDNDAFTAQKYVQDHDEKLYRRSMYTFWKRTSAPATLTTFDAPDRQVCTVRRPRTNTPLQALALLNDPTFVEAARKLAGRMLAADTDDRQRIAYAFRLATARRPTAVETDLLVRLYQDQLARFRADENGARRLLAVGESALGPINDPVDLAAWTMVASAILNLDETITKG